MTTKVVVLGAGAGIDTSAIIERLRQWEVEVHSMDDYHQVFYGERALTRLDKIARAIAHKEAHHQSLNRTADYWTNFIDMRDREVERQTRRPPKKATCTTRRRGRKCKK